jgi:DNA-binding PadR family transcriptional regulator
VKREPEPPCTPASADTIARVQALTSKWPAEARRWIPSLPLPTLAKLSSKETLVLRLLDDSASARGPLELYGLDLVAGSAGRLKRGTVYVLLARMQERGLIASRVEDDDGFPIDIPPRRKYWPTEQGLLAIRRRAPPARRGRVLAAVAALGEPYSLQVADQLLAAGTATWWDRRLHPQVQPELRHLERAGLLVSREGESLPERGGRPRFYYRLTEKGQAIVAGARWEDVP